MDYGFVSRDDMRGQRYSIRKGQYIRGMQLELSIFRCGIR